MTGINLNPNSNLAQVSQYRRDTLSPARRDRESAAKLGLRSRNGIKSPEIAKDIRSAFEALVQGHIGYSSRQTHDWPLSPDVKSGKSNGFDLRTVSYAAIQRILFFRQKRAQGLWP